MTTKDLKNPKKWVDFFVFLLRKFVGKVAERAGYNTPEDLFWKSEVISYRSLICSECKEAGKCVGVADGETEACGCDFIGKSTDMSLECSCGLWRAVKDKKDWEDQKSKYYNGLKLGFTHEFK